MSITITDPNSDFSGMGIGWAGAPLPISDLYAAYFPGSTLPNPPLADYAYQGRDGVASVGVTYEPSNLVGGDTSYIDAPFSADQLLSARGEATFCVVHKVGSTASNAKGLFLNYTDLTTKAVGLGTFNSYRGFANPGTGSAIYASLPTDAYTGQGFEFLALTLTATQAILYRKASAAAVAAAGVAGGAAIDLTAVQALTVAPGGAAAMRIGRARGSTYNNGTRVAMAAAYARAKSAADVHAIYLAAKAFLAGRSTPIVI